MKTSVQMEARPARRARPVYDSPFARDVLTGLSDEQKSIPCRWLYDRRGSELFEQITEVPEYYPTRTEDLILKSCVEEIAALAGPGVGVIELGSGLSCRTPLLLSALDSPACHVPVDVSSGFLQMEAWTSLATSARRLLVHFPGSKIGNLAPDAAADLLRRLSRLAGTGGLLVLGADATQDPSLLLPAYADAQGVTEAFNKNLLTRMNRELGADFDLDSFRHAARYDTRQRRMEMHLVSRRDQWVRVAGHRFHFDQGESIHTESSYKYGLLRIQAMARSAGWSQCQLWTDAFARFGVHVFERLDA